VEIYARLCSRALLISFEFKLLKGINRANDYKLLSKGGIMGRPKMTEDEKKISKCLGKMYNDLNMSLYWTRTMNLELMELKSEWASMENKVHKGLLTYFISNNVRWEDAREIMSAMGSLDYTAITKICNSIISIKNGKANRIQLLGKACVVFLTNPNAHSYDLGKVYMAYGPGGNFTRYASDQAGGMGNQSPQSLDSLRVATREEVESFIVNMTWTYRGRLLEPKIDREPFVIMAREYIMKRMTKEAYQHNQEVDNGKEMGRV
jgi:hypothetical protein